jgi:hypothetical protein
MRVEIIELLTEANDNGPHAWVDIVSDDHRMTMRVDRDEDGFRVYLRANDSIGQEIRLKV